MVWSKVFRSIKPMYRDLSGQRLDYGHSKEQLCDGLTMFRSWPPKNLTFFSQGSEILRQTNLVQSTVEASVREG